ncbi:MAG: 23S rRNA (adenine(2503)-C(2))-methyltransferase RlmN [Christensenellaceae bacterium]|nr:23S rRNA (adenine(2503)-C(2))-methyltransferase RlmN [Christensenellaceae bacterium]
MKKRLLDLSLSELKEELIALGEKPFRAGQIYNWLTAGKTFSEMTNLSKDLRSRLAENFSEGYAKIAEKKVSSDGTAKYLLELDDGNLIEAVVMVYEHGKTACISTQAGCAMGCAFCASTKGGLKRNLSAGEILSEVICLNADLGEGRNLTNLVLMGTGEPLANYDNVVRFLRLVNSPDSLNISFRNISLSTCGIVPGIRRLTEEGIPLTLCLSLHSAMDEKRREIMPIADHYSLEETLSAFADFGSKTGRRTIFEYILIKDFNDGREDVEALSKKLGRLNCHINLIPYNKVEGLPYESPSKKEVYAFLGALEKRGLSATVRRTLGQDIDGACGQLRARYIKD